MSRNQMGIHIQSINVCQKKLHPPPHENPAGAFVSRNASDLSQKIMKIPNVAKIPPSPTIYPDGDPEPHNNG